MKRLTDCYAVSCVLAPASVAASTETTTGFVDAKGKSEIAFLVAAASLANGKKLTVAVYAGSDASGTGAKKVAEKVFTASAAMEKVLVSASYKPKDGDGRYVGIKFQHDSAAAVVCGVTAAAADIYHPAENGWTLEA